MILAPVAQVISCAQMVAVIRLHIFASAINFQFDLKKIFFSECRGKKQL